MPVTNILNCHCTFHLKILRTSRNTSVTLLSSSAHFYKALSFTFNIKEIFEPLVETLPSVLSERVKRKYKCSYKMCEDLRDKKSFGRAKIPFTWDRLHLHCISIILDQVILYSKTKVTSFLKGGCFSDLREQSVQCLGLQTSLYK